MNLVSINVTISTKIININGLKSNIPTSGTTLRMGVNNGWMMLSRTRRIWLYGARKNDTNVSMIINITIRLDNKLMIDTSRLIISRYPGRGPKMACPTRTIVAPSSIAVIKSPLVPMDNSAQFPLGR